jgi:hypothetical protein
LRLIGAVHMARPNAVRLAARYDGDVTAARNAALQAASVNRRMLAAWLDRADVRAALATKETAERAGAALDAGDQHTIAAAACGDLPTAAQAAQSAEERRAAEADRHRDQDDANREAAQQAGRERLQEAVQQAARLRARVRAPQPPPTATPAPGLRLR